MLKRLFYGHNWLAYFLHASGLIHCDDYRSRKIFKKVISRYRDADGALVELVSNYNLDGWQVLEKRYKKSNFTNRRMSDFFGAIREFFASVVVRRTNWSRGYQLHIVEDAFGDWQSIAHPAVKAAKKIQKAKEV